MTIHTVLKLANPTLFQGGNYEKAGEWVRMNVGSSQDYDLKNDKSTAILCWFRRDTKHFQEFLGGKGWYAEKQGWRLMVKDDTAYRYNHPSEYPGMDALNSFQYDQIQADVADLSTFNYYKGIDSITDEGIYDHFAAFVWSPNGRNYWSFMSKSMSNWDPHPGCLVIDGKTHIEDKVWRMTCAGDYAQAAYNTYGGAKYADNQRNCDQVTIRECAPYDADLLIGANPRITNPDNTKHGFNGMLYEFEIWQGDSPDAITVDDVLRYYQRSMENYSLAPDAAAPEIGPWECPECAVCSDGATIRHICEDGRDILVAECVGAQWRTSGIGCELGECPPTPAEGETIDLTCGDGSVIAVAEYRAGVWTPTGALCSVEEEEDEDSNTAIIIASLVAGYAAGKYVL